MIGIAGVRKMRSKLFFAFAFVALVWSEGICSAEEKFDPYEGPKPIVVLVEADPWAMVIGSDTPLVAIYEDGLVVYTKRVKKEKPALFSKRLSRAELAELTHKLASFGDYSKLERGYTLEPNVTDLPETSIYLSPGKGEFVTSVYALTVHDADTSEYPEELPKPIRHLHSYLCSLDFADAKRWTPRYVEVMVWAYEYAPDASIHWPKDWPGLDSRYAIKRRNDYLIFLPGKELPRLRKFLKTQKKKGAVEINGKKWTVAYRYTFPSEPVWREAFWGEVEGAPH